VNQRAVEAAYAAGWRVVRALPRPVAAAAFTAGADLVTRRRGRAVRQLAQNLRRVVGPQLPEPDFDDLVRAAMRSAMRYYMEAFRLPSLSRQQILREFHLEGEELLAAAMAAGKGAVAALPHGGNYDLAGAWVAARGWPITTVAERLRPESVYRRFLAYRQSLGMEILPERGGERPTFDVLVERLSQGHFVPLLAERDLSRRGVPVTFFGARTRMPAGPALLALRTGAPLFIADMWYVKEGARTRLRGPVQLPREGSLDQRVQAVTQMIADGLAEGIREHPADWHMLQRLWLPEVPGSPGASATTEAGTEATTEAGAPASGPAG
jgi:phosphatidylinositol dimannoside acyltransferase